MKKLYICPQSFVKKEIFCGLCKKKKKSLVKNHFGATEIFFFTHATKNIFFPHEICVRP